MQTFDRQRWPHPHWGRVVKNFLELVTVAAIITSLDVFTKFLVVQNLEPHESWAPIPAMARIIKITFIYNSGAAFGLFQNGNIAFTVIALLVVVIIVVYYTASTFAGGRFLLPEYRLVRLSVGLQLGGALGNVINRIRFTEGVVDFVDIGFWPIFNLADVSIVAGICLLTYSLWQEETEERSGTE